MTLDEAWAEAEAALPKGWNILLAGDRKDGYYATGSSGRVPGTNWYTIVSTTANRRPKDPTPTAALHALAIALRTREGEAG